MAHPLDRLLWPRSIAIVGAAPTGAHRTRGQLVRYLVAGGYGGRILPVNPSYAEIDGIACHASLAAVGEPVDVAVLALPAPLIPAALEDCARAGVAFAVVLSAGFVESGAEGADLQRRLGEIARRTGVRVIGPNCQGFANLPGRVTATFSPTVAPGAAGGSAPVSGRRVGIVAQSGGIGYSLLARGRAAGIGFSHIVSTGNEVDLTLSEVLDYLVHDERTDVVMLFCETIRDPQRFVAALADARRVGKPIVALKVGASQAAQRAAASHTAALTGWDTGYRAVFDRYGVVLAEHPDEAVAIAGVLATCPLPRGRRAGIVTVSGGGGALMADMLAANDIEVPVLSRATQEAIRAYIPAHGSTHNPIDLTLNSADLVMPTLELLERCDEVDAIVLVTQLASGEILPIDPARMRAIVERAAKPIVTWTYTLPSDAGRQAAADGGLFLNLDLRNAGRALGRLASLAESRRPPAAWVAAADAATGGATVGSGGGASPAGAAPGAAPGAAGRRTLTEHDARRLLAGRGFEVGVARLARTVDEAVAVAATFPVPVALKVQSPDVPHKTDAGGVELGLRGEVAVREAWSRIDANVRSRRPGARIDGLLVQPMAPRGPELVVGAIDDPAFGPILMVGMGGVAIELFGDVVHRPAPVDATEAAAMLMRLKSSPLLRGFRGAPPIDVAPVADLVARLSGLALAERGRIAEIELNPVILHADGSGITLADALIVLADGVEPMDLTRS